MPEDKRLIRSRRGGKRATPATELGMTNLAEPACRSEWVSRVAAGVPWYRGECKRFPQEARIARLLSPGPRRRAGGLHGPPKPRCLAPRRSRRNAAPLHGPGTADADLLAVREIPGVR